MRAIVVDHYQEPTELVVSEQPAPPVEPGLLQVEVRAAGCNFFDILIVQGRYQQKPPFPFVPGAEVAGVVSAVGAGVEGWQVGDRVMASLPWGAYAERVNVPPLVAAPIPAPLSFEQAAGFPIVYGTAHAALVHRAALQPGETLLVTAAAGGVGLASVQLGKALGARVIALAGGPEKLAVCREAGADVAIDYGRPSWADEVRDASGGGVDVVVENVGGAVFEGCLKALRWGGRLIVVGFAGGTIPEVKLNRVLLKHIALIGLHWGPMVMHEPGKVRATQRALHELCERGALSPRVWKTFPLEEAGAALTALGSRQSWGKVVLRV